MKRLVIIGAGDFGREVSWIVERINSMGSDEWNLLGFLDDNPVMQGKVVDGYPVLGPITWLEGQTKEIYMVCAVGMGKIRKALVEKAMLYPFVKVATLIDPTAIIGRNSKIGEGCIVGAGTVLTVNTELKEHVILNLNCSVGHDAVLDKYCTVNPGSNISGKVYIGECSDIGTGAKIIQGKNIASEVVIGAGGVVIKDIVEAGTYVGVPVRRIG